VQAWKHCGNWKGIIEVLPNSTRKLFVKYMDASGNRIGGYNVTVTGGTYVQGSVSVTLTPKAHGAEKRISGHEENVQFHTNGDPMWGRRL
jgi:hypothetical protein